MHDKPRSPLRKYAPPVLIVLLTVGAIGLLMATRPELRPVEKPERVWPVAVVEARYGSVQPQLELFGEIVAGRLSELRPQVSGTIVQIGEQFHEGGIVKTGELLLQVDVFDYETARAEQRSLLKKDEAKLAKLQRDLTRARELFAEKNISEQFLDDAQLAVTEQAALVEQGRIELRRAERDLTNTRLVAPFDGVLANVNADLGKQISDVGNEMVAEIIDTSSLEVRFNLSNAQYGRLLKTGESMIGRPVEVTWSIGERQLSYPAAIERVGAKIAATTGGVEVFAVIDSAGQQTSLRPGAFVSVSLQDRNYDSVLRAPETALYGEDIVYVVEADRMSPRKVQILGRSGTELLFVSDGEPRIVDGDTIIVTQLREAGSGARISLR